MIKENRLLIIWIIFGFVFIKAIDSILYFFTHIVYFSELEFDINFIIAKYSIPIITFLSYIIITFILLRKIKSNSDIDGIYFNEFPKNSFLILATIAIFLIPITNKLSSLYTEHHLELHNINSSDYLEVYNWMHTGLLISRWLILITLIIIYLKIKPIGLKTKHNRVDGSASN